MSHRFAEHVAFSSPAVGLVPIAGCAALQPTSQPAGEIDAQQLTGQVVAGVQAELTGIRGDATGYNSEFGVGAVLVVGLTLILALVLSHRREMARLKRRDS